MLHYLISIGHNIILLMLLLITHFGWYDKLHIIMAIGCAFVAILEVYFLARRNYFLAKCSAKKKKWDLIFAVWGLMLDLLGLFYFSGIWQ